MATKLTGAQKTAILMLAFGEEISAEIFRNMNEFEIKRIGSAMSRLGRVDDDHHRSHERILHNLELE